MAFGPQFAKLADSGGLAGEGSAPRREAIFYAAAAIEDGDLVVVDLADTTYGLGASMKISTTDVDLIPLGIADQDIAAGTFGRIVTYGVKLGAKAAGVLAAGEAITQHNVVGTVTVGTIGTNDVIGFALTVVDSGAADVFVQLG